MVIQAELEAGAAIKIIFTSETKGDKLLKNKKIWLVVGILIAVVIAFVAIYVNKKPKESFTKTSLEQISETKMLWPQVSSDQKGVYYFDNSKEAAFYKMDLKTKK